MLHFGVGENPAFLSRIVRTEHAPHELKLAGNSCTSVKHSTRLIDDQNIRFTGGVMAPETLYLSLWLAP